MVASLALRNWLLIISFARYCTMYMYQHCLSLERIHTTDTQGTCILGTLQYMYVAISLQVTYLIVCQYIHVIQCLSPTNCKIFYLPLSTPIRIPVHLVV